MNKFRKIFVIIAIVISVLTISFVVTVKNVKTNIHIDVGTPYAICVFDHSTSGYEIEKENISDFVEEFHKITNVSVYDKLFNGSNLDKRILQNADGSISGWSTSLKSNNIVVEFIYDTMQDLVVYQENDSRVISYYCLSFVIPDSSSFSDVFVYYSFTSNNEGNEKDNSYADCSPLILKGNASNFVGYLEKIKEMQN